TLDMLARPHLVIAVSIGVKETDHEPVKSLLAGLFDGGIDILERQGRFLSATGPQPATHLEDVPARNQRRGPIGMPVIGCRDAQALDDEQITKTARDEQPQPRA